MADNIVQLSKFRDLKGIRAEADVTIQTLEAIDTWLQNLPDTEYSKPYYNEARALLQRTLNNAAMVHRPKNPVTAQSYLNVAQTGLRRLEKIQAQYAT